MRKGKFIAAICVAVVAAVWGAAYAPRQGDAPSLAAPPGLWALGLSKAVGLDFSAYAGQNVKVLGFRVRDAGGKRLTQYHLVADVIIHPDAGRVGAWLCAPEETPGEIKRGEFRCYGPVITQRRDGHASECRPCDISQADGHRLAPPLSLAHHGSGDHALLVP